MKVADQIEFCTTATVRPELLRRTYQSFSDNIAGVNLKDCALYITIDPLPKKSDKDAMIQVASEFFGEVRYYFSKVPHLTNAVKRCFAKVQKPYSFYLQDDWVLTREVDMDKMLKHLVEIHGKDNTFVQVRLPTSHNRDVKKRNRVFLSPALWESDRGGYLISTLDSRFNPEYQLRLRPFKSSLWPEITKVYVEDIGREWLDQSPYRRSYGQSGRFFTRWVKK